jgi:hypothetical protein
MINVCDELPVRKLSNQGHGTGSLAVPPMCISHPNAWCAKCSPNGAAVDADMAPYPSYGPTLLVEPGGDHNLSPIRAEAAQSHAPAMQVPGHRGPVDAEPLG